MLGRKTNDLDSSASGQEDACGPYQVVLQSAGGNKIAVIKELRALSKPHLDLPDAKRLVLAAEASPQVLLRFEDRGRAEAAAARFEAGGAVADVEEGDVVAAAPAGGAAQIGMQFTCPFCTTVSFGSHCDNCGAPRHAT